MMMVVVMPRAEADPDADIGPGGSGECDEGEADERQQEDSLQKCFHGSTVWQPALFGHGVYTPWNGLPFPIECTNDPESNRFF